MEAHGSSGAARRVRLALALLVCAAGHVGALQDTPPFEITDAVLARIAAEELPLVRETLGVELAHVEVRLGTRAEISDSLAEENAPILARHRGDAERGVEEARPFAEGMAPMLLAKYCFDRDLVLIQLECFTRVGKLLGMPELSAEPVVRAVVLHELVHAADDERYGLADLFARCTSADAIRAANAVIEGHAQLVARDLAPRLGCAEGLAVYTRSITAPPAGLVANGDSGTQLVLRASATPITSSYVEGEPFFEALRRAGGDAAIRKAFLEPPADPVLIVHPEWYLDPRSRPRMAFDLDPALAAFEAHFEDAWRKERAGVTSRDLRATFAPLAVEEIDALFADLRQARTQSAAHTLTGGEVSLSVYEFGAPACAAGYTAAFGRMQKLRDEAMKTGAFRVLASDYEELSAPDPDGWRIEKRISAGLVMDVTLVCVRQGTLAIQAIAGNSPEWDGERLLAAAVAALAEAQQRPRPADSEGR